MSVAGLAQGHLNAGAAIGLAAVPMDLDNLLDQARIFLGAWAGLGLAVEPVVIAAGGDFQGFAERANGMVRFSSRQSVETAGRGFGEDAQSFF